MDESRRVIDACVDECRQCCEVIYGGGGGTAEEAGMASYLGQKGASWRAEKRIYSISNQGLE